jgi:hypothetical protein
MGHGIVGIERRRLFEQAERLDQRQPRKGLEMGPRLELQEIGLRRPRPVAVHAMIAWRRLWQRRRHACGDRVLQGRTVYRRLLETLAPLRAPARHLDQPRPDVQSLGAALDLALQQMVHAERAGVGKILDSLDRRNDDTRHAPRAVLTASAMPTPR